MSHTADEAARRVQEHPECPWCGGRARIEWGECDGIPDIRPVCVTCGFGSVTGLPVPGGAESLSMLSCEHRESRLAPAWEGWDNAWWVRQGKAMFEAGSRMAGILKDLADDHSGRYTQGLIKDMVDTWADATRDTRRPW